MSENSRLYFLLRRLIKAVESIQPSKGNYKNVHIDPSDGLINSPTNKVWEVLSGVIYHVNLTDTEVNFWYRGTNEIRPYFTQKILAATATGSQPLDLKGSRIILTEWDSVDIVGDAASDFDFKVLEKDV